jgi:AraC-like DNA-binding protein
MNKNVSPSLSITEILRDLRDRLLPWVQQDGIHRMAVTGNPLRVTPGIQVKHREADGFIDGEEVRAVLLKTYWAGNGMFALRYPYLCCVLEGEIDIRVRCDDSGTQNTTGMEPRALVSDFTLSERSLLLITPETPCRGCGAVEGSLHWERSYSPPSSSRVFWLQILPEGVICHICSTTGGHHGWSPCFFLPDLQISLFIDLLIQEFQQREPGFELLARNHLHSVFLRLLRGFLRREQFQIEEEGPCKPFVVANPLPINFVNERSSLTPSAAVVARARSYILSHLNEPLNVEKIARHSHVSPSHLARIFKMEIDLPVMKFVTLSRMEHAQALLRDTELSVEEVGRLVGYRHLPHFSQVFAREISIPPMAFRKNCRMAREDSLSPTESCVTIREIIK